MPERRPAIPAQLKRDLMEEAGYRCAIPTCKGTDGLELAHIIPWSEVKTHDFQNMIVLCSIDHYRYDIKKQIPRKSIEAYKANLGLLRSRYSDAERRILEAFALNGSADTLNTVMGLPIPGGTAYTMMYLVKDGLVSVTANQGIMIGGLPPYEIVTLTHKGIEFVRRLQNALEVDGAN